MTRSCTRCGVATVELPDGLSGAFLELLERTGPVCAACTQELDAAETRAGQDSRDQERGRQLARRREASGIPARYRGLDLAQLHADTELVHAARRCAHGELPGLVLGGPVGVGKTWIAAAIAWQLLERQALRWLSVPVLFAHLGLAFDNPIRERALEVLGGTTALVLDDLDKARPSEFAAEQIFCAVDGRVSARRPLIATTNLTLSELAARFPQPHGEAIVSRLVEHCGAFALEGADRRTARRLAS
jgi:DNA replication protein DnaC